jgi:hypothetical protein
MMWYTSRMTIQERVYQIIGKADDQTVANKAFDLALIS